MTPLRIRRLIVFVSASLFPAALGAGTFDDPVLYELRPGSTLVDDCQNCDRAPIERSLAGTFTLTHVESLRGTVYALNDLDLRDPTGDYVVKGSGMYTINDDIDGSQEVFFDVTVNGESITLRGGRVEVPVAWPAIDIRASQEPRGPDLRFFTIRMVASPPALDVPYELVPGDPVTQEGSFLLIGLNCPMCAVVPTRVPIAGTFLLGQISSEPTHKVYRVDRALFEGMLDGVPHRVEGAGTFEVSGDPSAPLVRMRLVADIDGQDRVLDSGPIASPAVFPEIDVDLFHSSPQVPPGENFHGLEIVARPSAPHGMRFLRGDSNADNSVDIADPIHTLLWLFAGGTVPGCLDAADSTGDAGVDITDPVFTLDYLFRSGPAPEAPGPEKCGPPPLRPGAGCVNPAPCEP